MTTTESAQTAAHSRMAPAPSGAVLSDGLTLRFAAVDGLNHTAVSASGKAVYCSTGGKRRETDAGTGVKLYARRYNGTWTYNDTTAEWE